LATEPGSSDHYRKRAEELRTVAGKFQTDEARKLLMQIASHYDKLADKLDQQGSNAEGAQQNQPPRSSDKRRPSGDSV
jgi:hypothetical protein